MRVGIVLLCAALVWAQDEPAVFRTGTRLVQVDVVVREKSRAVMGLTKDDFKVTDNGKPQTIAVFSVRQAAPSVAAPLPPGIVANRPQARGGDPVSATVVLIDRQNTALEDQGYARLQALKYLDRSKRTEQIALYELGTTLKVLQQFTDDRDLLRKAMDKSKMEQSFNLMDGQNGLLAGVTGNAAAETRRMAQLRRNDITTGAFASVARQLEGLPGRKKLIWITAGLPLHFTTDTERNGVSSSESLNMTPQLFRAMKMLNDGNVALYPIDPRGVFGTALSDEGVEAMISLADLTGGKAFYADNDVAAELEQAVTDTDVTYTLGYYVTEEVQDGTFHDIRVAVARPGAEVRYRRGYSAGTKQKPLTEKQRKGTLSDWVVEPLDATQLGLQGRARPVSGRPGYFAVEVIVDPAELQLENKNGRWVGMFDFALVANKGTKPKGLEQRIKVNLSQDGYLKALNKGIIVANTFKTTDAKGKLIAPELKAVVMDEANGKAGAVRIPVQ